MIKKYFFIISFLIISSSLNAKAAGVIEIGASGSYHTSTLKFSNTVSKSITGSLSYYFWELSAIELSYTNGRNEGSSETEDKSQKIVTLSNFELYGADFVLTLAGKEAAFRPYIKAGGLFIKQSTVYTLNNNTPTVDRTEGMAPSAGLGFRLLLTQSFVIKIGIDVWTSPTLEKEVKFDCAGRAGISWLF